MGTPGWEELLKDRDINLTILTREFRGSVAFFLSKILTFHSLGIAFAIILGFNASQISSIYSATANLVITI